MVTVFFRGGLGNQMFQYATGFSLARANNTKLMLDTVHVSDRFPRPHFTYRTFDLPDVFAVTPHLTNFSRAAATVPIPGAWLGLDLLAMNVAQGFGKVKIMYEDERRGFDPSVPAARGNLILYGRWENENYFKKSEAELREEFRFRHPLEGGALPLAEEIAKTNSVSIHVRRGDFAKSKVVTGMMGQTNLAYYERAIGHVAKNVADPHFFIFSDDIAWVKENLSLKFPATYAEPFTSGPKAAFHLELMSRCKHNIVANSTFSWWGAWLNRNAGKMVIAPKQWYADPARSKEIIPESWVAM